MNRLPEKIIDFHVHLFPDKLLDAIWNAFSTRYKWDVLYKLYYRDCVNFLNERNVTPVVYSNYAHKKGIAEGLNQWNMKILDEFPNLYCFAAFHPDDDNGMEIAENILSHPKVLGFKLQLLVQNFYPYDERLFPLYDLVMEKNKRILFHAGTGPIGNQYVGIKNFKKMLKKYPDIPANIAHMGALEYKEFMDLLNNHENLYFDTAFTFFKNADMGFNLDSSYLELNKDRILYGSDFPNLIFPREEEINTLLEMGLSDEFYQKIFFDNGMKLIDKHSGSR
ncbi:MAG: amidohydrolase family protein [Deltaproteobacteria bacterium]|nr:amidohydrolase family protein [Deltaproteobacteria bacterium]MBW2218178.1 amidohydrolase family protein [Deltaproteobacteria bacterium]